MESTKAEYCGLIIPETEYVSQSEAIKEAMNLKGFLAELGLNEMAKITLNVDNRGAICLASDHMFHSRTKHIDIRHHFIRDVIDKDTVIIKHIPTGQMTADILTKPLVRLTHQRCMKEFGYYCEKNND